MTAERIGFEMSDEEIASLLNSKGHGVLSMGVEDRGYGIPISYAYDEADERVIVAFVNIGESKKQRFAEATEEVTLTVYNYSDRDSWESVVVTGTIHALDETEVYDRSAAKFFSQADDAAGEYRWIDSDEIERQWYEIRATDVTGRHGGELPHQQSRGLLRFSRFNP